MPYPKTTWVEKVTTVGPTHLNNLESGVAAAPYGPDGSAHFVPVGDGSGGWVYKVITNAEIDAAAAIVYSKLALSNSIVNADIAAGAAIAYAKLALGSSIVNADVANAAAIAYSKLALSGAIQDGDIKTGTNLIKLAGVTGTPNGSKFLRDDGSWQLPAGGATYLKIGSHAVNTVGALTDLLNGGLTIPILGTTSVVRLTAWGDYLRNNGTEAYARWAVTFGATTLFDTGASAGADAADAVRYPWKVVLEIKNDGATNSQVASLLLHVAAGVSANGPRLRTWTTPSTGGGNEMASDASGRPIYIGQGSNTSAEDTTSTKALTLKVQPATNNVNDEVKLFGAYAEVF